METLSMLYLIKGSLILRSSETVTLNHGQFCPARGYLAMSGDISEYPDSGGESATGI